MSTLVADTKLILTSPRAAWEMIEARGTPARDAIVNHFMPLALIPAVAQFIGSSVIGVQVFGTTYRMPLLRGLISIPLSFLVMVASALIFAAILRALAPRFGGTQDWDRAVSLVAYGSTAALAGGIFALLPLLSILSLIAGMYAIYTLYLGLVPIMHVDAARRAVYLVVSLILAFICNMVLSLVLMPFNANPMRDEPFSTPAGNNATSSQVDALNRLEEFGRQIQQAMEEQAAQSR